MALTTPRVVCPQELVRQLSSGSSEQRMEEALQTATAVTAKAEEEVAQLRAQMAELHKERDQLFETIRDHGRTTQGHAEEMISERHQRVDLMRRCVVQDSNSGGFFTYQLPLKTPHVGALDHTGWPSHRTSGRT